MTQIVDAAIKQSRTKDEIVHLTRTEIRQAGVSLEVVHAELHEACESVREVGGVVEYRGHGSDGADDEPWRVHVPAEVAS